MSAPIARKQYEAFVSYHSTDIDAVRQIAETLRERKIEVWWDEWCLPPGWSFQQRIDDGLQNCGSTIVILGPSGLGEWQKKEVEMALVLGSRGRHPVIPVFLPGSWGQIQLPAFLETHGAVKFRDSVAEKAALDRLQWGITGVNPNAPPALAAAGAGTAAVLAVVPPDPVDQAASDIVSWLKEYGGVTFFLGGAASGESDQTPPRNYEITRELLKKLHLGSDEGENAILPPLDFAATYYAVGNDEPMLEQTVIQLIQSRSGAIPKTHQRLAELVPHIKRIPPPRGRVAFKQVIFTTNLDLMIERAFIKAGIEFTRLVQHRSDTRVHVTEYRDFPRELPVSGVAGLDTFLRGKRAEARSSDAVVLDNLKDPILYKFRGSEDIPDSCVLTSPQCFEFAKAVLRGRIVPEGIESVLSNTRLVFLGCGLLDQEVRLTHHTILSEPLKSSHQKYLVQIPPDQDSQDPYRHMELGIWNRIKETGVERRIKTVEARSDEFLNLLREKLQS